MRNLIKYVCIAMIVIAIFSLFVESYLLLSSITGAPASVTFSFINHLGMFIVGVLGLKFRNDNEKQKMLAGISGMQMILCLLAVYVCNTLWITLKMIGIGDILAITTSAILLIYYIKGAIKYKKEQQIK